MLGTGETPRSRRRRRLRERMSAPSTIHRLAPYALLLALCAALYLPGLASLPVTDRDEARFAQATRQMIESGDYIAIRFQDEPRHKKPVGIHWAQAACARLAAPFAGEDSIWPYRVPSAFGATLAVLLMFALHRPHIGAAASLLGAALLASSLLLIVEAHLATTDALLLATIVAAQGALMNRLLRPSHRPMAWSMLFWVAQGLAILIKGPVAPLVAILTLLGWRVGGNRLRPLSVLHWHIGLPAAALIIAPWLVAISLTSDESFLRDAWLGDLLPKLISGHESHGFPPGFYLLLVTLTFWPGSLLAGFAVVDAWRRRADPAVRFLLAWLGPTWLAFEVVPTKLPHYVLPLYPALAALTAAFAVRLAQQGALMPQPRRRAIAMGWGVWALVTLGLGAAASALPPMIDARLDAWLILPAAAALLAAALGLLIVRRRDAAPLTLVLLVACSGLFSAPILARLLPRSEALWPSRSAARLARAADPPASTALPWAAVGYHEPSLVFYLGTRTRLTGPVRAAEALARGEVTGVIVEARQREAFEAHAAALGLAIRQRGAVHGLNASKGEYVTLLFYAAAPAEAGER